MIDNDKCEDSVPQCGIIAHSGFVDQKRSENTSRWDGTAQKRTELSGMRWMLSELVTWRKGERHVLTVASHLCVCFIGHTIHITFKTFECRRPGKLKTAEIRAKVVTQEKGDQELRKYSQASSDPSVLFQRGSKS